LRWEQAIKSILYIALALGLVILSVGVVLSLSTNQAIFTAIAIILQTLGSAIVFPILVSFAYDRIRERWVGDTVWRIFGELTDAGIDRIYPNRESAPHGEDAQTRLSLEFLATRNGEVRMMGPSLRVFFHPLGPLHDDIRKMLTNGGGKVRIRALIQRTDSPAFRDRVAIEHRDLPPETQSQGERDVNNTIAEIRRLNASLGELIKLRQFMPAPYCTAIISPNLAFISPNILSPDVPVRLPMIVYRASSNGYRVIEASFEYLWTHEENQG